MVLSGGNIEKGLVGIIYISAGEAIMMRYQVMMFTIKLGTYSYI